jgi:hypothetical protein
VWGERAVEDLIDGGRALFITEQISTARAAGCTGEIIVRGFSSKREGSNFRSQ